MAAALRHHDDLLRATIESHGGYVFQMIGDAFCAAFETALDAASAAAACQQALLAEDFSAVEGLRVRMALHTGTAEERDGDYFGPAVNRVARLLAIGYGSQILVSGTTADLLQAELPREITLRDLGEHRLKDLARPERVYQLVSPNLPNTFPPLRSVDEFPNNLPSQLTSFVGRDSEIDEIKASLQRDRLVTLVGSAGVGKTRCAIQVGAEVLAEFEEGVWLVELASISDPGHVTAVIAQSLKLAGESSRPLIETILARLSRGRFLIILDNCEHVIDEVRNACAAIVRACPDVRVLATSLEALSISGERVIRLSPLDVPPTGDPATVDSASAYGAIKLFCDRARASDGQFKLSEQNVPFVEEICRRLDGIPLAIELAASRVRVLSPRQLARLLDQRFRVLTAGDRSAMPRHQTMRALIDWSYDLLSERERHLFRRLAICAATFSLETATRLSGDDAYDEIAILDLLSSLVEKSLMQADPSSGSMRYKLLESTRQYGREKLTECGEYDATAHAYAAALLEVAESLEGSYEDTSDREWFARASLELENWRAVLEWSLSEGRDLPTGQRLAGALHAAWSLLAPAEGHQWLVLAVRGAASAPENVIAQLHLAEAAVNSALLQNRASYGAAQQALSFYRKERDSRKTAQCLRYAGLALLYLGEAPAAETALSEALSAARTARASKLVATILECMAQARESLGDFGQATTLHCEALALYDSRGEAAAAARVTYNLAEAEFHCGDVQRALELGRKALEGHRSLHHVNSAACCLCNISAYLVALGRYEEAKTAAREAIQLAQGSRNEVIVLFSLQHIVAAALGAIENPSKLEKIRNSARVIGFIDARLAALEVRREYTEQREYDAMLDTIKKSLPDVEAFQSEGCELDENAALTAAVGL